MKCNLQSRYISSWFKLPQKERDAIEQAKAEEARRLAEDSLAETQEVWLKMDCMLLHNVLGLTEDQLIAHLLAWKRAYRMNLRIQTKEEQDAWLDAEMKKCFPTGGYPQTIIDDIRKRGNE